MNVYYKGKFIAKSLSVFFGAKCTWPIWPREGEGVKPPCIVHLQARYPRDVVVVNISVQAFDYPEPSKKSNFEIDWKTTPRQLTTTIALIRKTRCTSNMLYWVMYCYSIICVVRRFFIGTIAWNISTVINC